MHHCENASENRNTSPFTRAPRDKLDHNPYVAATFVTVNILQLLATIVANVLLCVAVYKVQALRTLANAFLVSLSFVDLLFVAVFAFNIVRQLPNEGDHDILCSMSSELFHALTCLVVLHLLGIAIDRLLAITLHLRYHQVVTGPRVAIAIAVIWVFGIVEASLPPMLLSTAKEETHSYRKIQQNCLPNRRFCSPWNDDVKRFVMIEKMFSIAIPYVVILLCYAWIFKISWRHHQQIYNQRGRSTEADSTTKVEMKAAKTTAIIVGSFVVMFTPLLVASVHRVFVAKPPDRKRIMNFIHILMPGLQALAGMSAILNPLVYAWCNRPFREAFGTILKPFYSCLPRCIGSRVSTREPEQIELGN